jgi:hypothetical protein
MIFITLNDILRIDQWIANIFNQLSTQIRNLTGHGCQASFKKDENNVALKKMKIMLPDTFLVPHLSRPSPPSRYAFCSSSERKKKKMKNEKKNEKADRALVL